MVPPPNDELWRALWTGQPSLPTHRKRRFFAHIPSSPRCRVCLAPFQGVGGPILRIFGTRPSTKNPNFCAICEQFARDFPGGAEVQLALLFADLRGSTSIAEHLAPHDFKRKIDAFYAAATEVLIEFDAYIDRLVGDQVVGLFMPGLAGPGYAFGAVKAAAKLVATVAREARLPIGAGVHSGVAYVGTVEGASGVGRDIAAVGDPVNTTARLASAAKAGEVLISEEAIKASGFDSTGLELRHLTLKGKSRPFSVRVLPVPTATN